MASIGRLPTPLNKPRSCRSVRERRSVCLTAPLSQDMSPGDQQGCFCFLTQEYSSPHSEDLSVSSAEMTSHQHIAGKELSGYAHCLPKQEGRSDIIISHVKTMVKAPESCNHEATAALLPMVLFEHTVCSSTVASSLRKGARPSCADIHTVLPTKPDL